MELPATQAERNIAVETPLGPDVLLLDSFRLVDVLNHPFTLDLQLRSQLPVPKAKTLLGESVTVRITMPNGRERYLNGYVTQIGEVSTERDLMTYEARVMPWFGLLQLTTDSRIFHQLTVPEIVKEVFSQAGYSDYRFELTRNYDEKGICTQYDESHFHFVSRLLEQEGIAYYFEHEKGKHTMVLADNASGYTARPGYDSVVYQPQKQGDPDIERVFTWRKDYALKPASLTVNDYDYTTPRADLLSTAKASDQLPALGAKYESPGYYETEGEGENYADIRMQELNAERECHRGEARCSGFETGATFQLVDTPWGEADGEYLITSIELQMEAADYSSGGDAELSFESRCHLQALSTEIPFRPKRVTPRPKIPGVQSAVVVGPDGHNPKIPYTTAIGSVKVQFRWDRDEMPDDQSSGWMRVTQISAGNGYGSMFIPRIGNEVLVAFEYGDPDRPVIVGHLYNYVNKPPLSLPKMAQRCYINDDGGNAFQLIPDEGGQAIVLYSPTKDSMRVIGASNDPGAHKPPVP